MMFSRHFYVIFGFYFLFIHGDGCSGKEHGERRGTNRWGYSKNNGADEWDGECRTGKNQSPINIKLASAILKNFGPFHFGEGYSSREVFRVEGNGHTLEISLHNDTVRPVVYGGGMGGEFVFEQLHFHWESEHEFAGRRADLEMHMVHYNSKYKNFEEAKTKADGVVVFAVLFDNSEDEIVKPENFFDDVTESAASIVEPPPIPAVPPSSNSIEADSREQSGSSVPTIAFALRDLVPPAKFFRYDGSLTTPQCNQVVQWTVFVNRFHVPNHTLETFRSLRDHENERILQNFRPPQPLNERKVYLQIKSRDTPDGSNGNDFINKRPSFALCIINLFLWLINN